MADQQEKKRGPEWQVRIATDKPNRLRRETAFLCNIRFKNDLPEIPCDPKLLLPPYSKEEIAAFKLTELEKDLRKDLLFEPDLGIPIHPWNIERYSVPEVVPPLHPDDAALVASDEELEPKRARLRGDAAEVSWLLRTKYMTAEAGLRRGAAGAGAGAAARAAAAAGAAGEESEDPREARLRQIGAQFAAAKAPPVHVKDPSLVPVEVLPVFPDDLMEGRSCVLATFDNHPLDDVEHLGKLPPEVRARATQAHQLKSFRPPKGQQFVALLVPQTLPPQGDDELSARGGIPAKALVRDYQWVREYTGAARLDDRASTYLFRFSDDGTVRFHDLNTKLDLRKRKRQQRGDGDDDEDDQQALLPEKVLLRLPGQEYEEEEEEQQRQQDGAQQQRQGGGVDWGEEDEEGGGGGGAAGGGSEGDGADGSAGGSGEAGGGGEMGGRANEKLRDVFGSDDDDI
ncbi:hypothetical protein ABPG75_002915 [Micractinium tetrahymenae]